MNRFRSPLLMCSALTLAAAIASGCGSDGPEGGRAFVAKGSPAVVEISLREADLQQSLDTLGRIPAWKFAEDALPAQDAEGIIDEILSEAFDGKDKSPKPDEVKSWLGDHAGASLLPEATKVTNFSGDALPVMWWIDSEDDDKAEKFLEKYNVGKVTTSQRAGVTIHWSKDDPTAWFVSHGAVVVTTSVDRAEKLIDLADDGDETLFDTKYVEDLMDASDRDEQFAALADVEVLTEMLANFAAEQSNKQIAKSADVLRSDAVNDLLPNFVSVSGGVDDRGIWFDTGWAPAAKPTSTEARAAAERMPDEALQVAGGSGTSTSTENLPPVWDEVKKAYRAELEALPAQCGEHTALCDALLDAVDTALDSKTLTQTNEALGEDSVAASGSWTSAGDNGMPGQETGFVIEAEDPQALVDMAESGVEKWAEVLSPYGVDLSTDTSDDSGEVTVRIDPDGKLMSSVPDEAIEGFTAGSGGMFESLFESEGARIPYELADEHTLAIALPASRLDTLMEAWEGDGPTIAENDDYLRDVKAAGAPKSTSMFMWIDLGGTIGNVLDTIAGASGSMERTSASVMVKNNLEHVGGLTAWSVYRGDDDEVGVVRMVIPIYE